MIIQTAFFGTDKAESFNNLIEEWLVGVIIFSLLTWYIAKVSGTKKADSYNGSALVTMMMLAVFAHVVWLLWHQIPIWYNSGHYPLGSTPYAARDFISYPVNLAFIVLIADIFSYITLKKRILTVPLLLSAIFMLISAVTIMAVHTRNGVLAASVSLLILAIACSYKMWSDKYIKSALVILVIPLIIITTLITGTINNDHRWEGFLDTLKVATDIENNKSWLSTGQQRLFPKTKSGAPLDSSAYLRIAWGTVALEGIKKHPMGYGYGLGAFSKYVEEEYGQKKLVSSHSGVLDFTLSNGIPGIILWVLFSASLLWSGWFLFMRGNPFGLLLILMLANFFTRTVLDGHFGGFRLKMFALFMGAIFFLATRTTEHERQC